jgi:tetratricopeptide (TPR) repeat protein
VKKKASKITGKKLILQWWASGLGLLLVLTASLRAENPTPEIEDNDHTPYHLALLDYKRGHFDTARTSIDTAEKAQPDDLPIKILKARILTEQHDFDDGEKLLRGLLAPSGSGPLDAQLALGDLLLRKRDFDGAAKVYDVALQSKPGDPDIMLKMIYTRVSVSDFITAGKYASKLKPLDPDHPSYYFAQAAIAQATGKTTDAETEIETVRTIYGITTSNRYLKTYLEVFSPDRMTSAATRAEPPATNIPPTTPAQHP